MTTAYVNKLEDVSTSARAGIVRVLGNRGDETALPAVLNALKDPKGEVRLAAIGASAKLGGEDAIAPLIHLTDLLIEGNEPEKAEAPLRQVLELAPKDFAIKERLARLYEALGKSDQARDLYLEIEAFYRKKGRTEEGIALLRRLKSSYPEDWSVRHSRSPSDAPATRSSASCVGHPAA